MELHQLNDIDGQTKVTGDSRSARWMTSEQLLDLGMNEVVYLKSGICDGKMVFVLFGADGTPAVVAENVTAAVRTAIEQGLSLPWWRFANQSLYDLIFNHGVSFLILKSGLWACSLALRAISVV